MAAVFDTPIHTNEANLDRVLAAGKPTLIVFETAGCEPCRSLAPTLKELAAAFAGRALVVQVEDAEEGSLTARFKLARIPTLVFWDKGREVARIEGAASASAVRAHVEYLLGGPRPAPASGPSVQLGGGPATQSNPPYGTGASRGTGGYGTTAPDGGRGGGTPIVVTDATFQTEVLQSPQPILVDFWAPWCGPCRMVSPIVEEFGREYAGRLRVAKVNTDENPAHASRLGIQGIPTLIFFKNGREVDRVVGAAPKSAIRSHVERVLSAR